CAPCARPRATPTRARRPSTEVPREPDARSASARDEVDAVTTSMTPEAKRKLSGAIRELRAYLIETLEGALMQEYRLAIPRAEDAGLDEARTAKRRRLEAWTAEQLRAEGGAKKKGARAAEDFRREAVKQAAYTLLNRLVFLRLLEAAGLRSPHVVTGGW